MRCDAMARLRTRQSGAGDSAQVRRHAREDDERIQPGEGEDDEDEHEDEGEDAAITEYEKQRLQTIERNNAMLASLQLPNLASSLADSCGASKAASVPPVKGGGPRRRSERLKSVGGKPSTGDDDDSSSEESGFETESLSPTKRKRKDQEYEPTDDDGSLSESEDEMDEHEEEILQEGASVVPDDVDMDDEVYALQQALALSLGASVEARDSPASSTKKKKRSPAKKKKATVSAEIDPVDELEDDPKPKPSKGKAKRKNQKLNYKRHFTEGEIDALFPFFDERGRGLFTLNDLERVSTIHDFTWTAEELLDMIHLFNRNHNGALDLVDFRNVATRCNLIISER
ncbi:hypothetical protein M758_1G000500 [Ceratodon purpureus]|nr:hypothetical protein M758_1G000500 [Ceratodon purpureus]